MSDQTGKTRCGFVALIGRPNSGKSSLMNTVVGETLSAVTTLPQTTRKNLRGIYTDERLQVIFVDTPGIHEGDHKFNDSMIQASDSLLKSGQVDVIGYVVDTFRDFGPEEDFIAGKIAASRIQCLVIFNKIDVCKNIDSHITAFQQRYPALAKSPSIRLSAIDSSSQAIFIKAITPLLPPGPKLFPEEDLTDQSMRFFAAEYLQKGIILSTREEVPHATFVEILDYQERPDKHFIDAVIHVETLGQRGILIGKGGEMIGRIRTIAEKEMTRLAGVPVQYRCHVKVTPKWRDNPRFLSSMGY